MSDWSNAENLAVQEWDGVTRPAPDETDFIYEARCNRCVSKYRMTTSVAMQHPSMRPCGTGCGGTMTMRKLDNGEA